MFFALRVPAEAGAPTLPAQTGLLIETLSLSASSLAFGAGGAREPAPLWRAQQASTYLEWGAAPSLTLVLVGAGERVAQGSQKPALGFEATELGARAPLWSGPDQTLSVQLSALAPGGPAALVRLDEAGRSLGAETRFLYFHDISLFGASAFVDAQAAWRLIGYDGISEFRADLTLGVRPASRVLLLLQGFGAATRTPASLVAAYGRPAYEKAQVSVVYDLGKIWSLQLGAYGVAVGRDARQDHGALLALWRRF